MSHLIVNGAEKTLDHIKIKSVDTGEYIEAWEARDKNDHLLWGRADTFTGTNSISARCYGLPVKSWEIDGNGSQTGIPSPDSIIMPTFCGVRMGNLYDRTATDANNGYESGAYLLQSGSTRSSAQYFISEYIPIKPETSYTLVYNSSSLNAPSVCFYNNSKQYINGESYSRILPFSFTTPTGTAYIRFSGQLNYRPTIMLNEGMTAEDYEPYGYKIPIICAGQTVPVYLGQTPTVRRVKKLVLNGKEAITKAANNPVFTINIGGAYAPLSDNVISTLSTHYRAQSNASGTGNVGDLCVCIRRGYSTMYIGDTRYDNATDFKTWLSAQYTNGTPVTIWYVLAEPTTGIVNEPLCKIGDYADELHSADAAVTIPTTDGNSTISVDTSLSPSRFEIKVHAKPCA